MRADNVEWGRGLDRADATLKGRSARWIAVAGAGLCIAFAGYASARVVDAVLALSANQTAMTQARGGTAPVVVAQPVVAQPVVAQPVVAQRVVGLPVVGQKVLADDFFDLFRSDTFYRDQRPSRSSRAGSAGVSRSRPSYLRSPPQPSAFGWFGIPAESYWESEPSPRASRRQAAPVVSGYRTVCVRSCDGFMFPISHGVSSDSFERDAAQCSRSCPGAKLFVHRLGDKDGDDLVDLSGQPYARLKNANLFRTTYVESCKCKPHAWEQEATDRHQLYAMEAKFNRRDKVAAAQIEQMRQKVKQDKIATAKRKAAAYQPVIAASTSPRSDVSRGQQIAAIVPAAPAVSNDVRQATTQATAQATAQVIAGASTPAAGLPASPRAAPVPVAALAAAPLGSVSQSVAAIDPPDPAVAGPLLDDDQPAAVAAPTKKDGGRLPRVIRLGEGGRSDSRRNEKARVSSAPGDWVAKAFSAR